MSAESTSSAASTAPPVTHYENFPVSSILCPKHLRPAVAAIYAFARTADDIADEGDASADQRLQDLASYRADLARAAAAAQSIKVSGQGDLAPETMQTATNTVQYDARWAQVFYPLAHAIAQYQLPVALLDDLLSAFMQDVKKNRDALGYADRAELLDYCRRSANPVGRLMLHLYGVNDTTSLAQSDAICTAPQLANFWQDLSEDIPRKRYYLTEQDRSAHGAAIEDIQALRSTANTRLLIADCASWARATMLKGSALVHRVPGRAGWELRLVVQGGLRILDKVDALQGDSLHTRPRIRRGDYAVMLWRSLWM